MTSPVRWSSLVPLTSAVLVLCGTTAVATAQVRMNLRNTMQIDALEGGASPDERFSPIESNAFAHGDVDGDGDLDLLVVGTSHQSLAGASRVWLNDGDGAFVRFVPLPTQGARCALFDADGDGDLDALLAGGRLTYAGPTPSSLFLNNGAGSFTASPGNGTPPLSNGIEARGLAAGDVDNDGDRDVVVLLDFAYARLWRNTGNATFVDDSAAVQPPIFGNAACALVDVEPDGDLDLLVQSNATTCEVRLNDGTGHFSLGSAVAHVLFPVNEAVADFDGDGRLDRAGVANDWGFGTPDLPYLRRNLGNGQFQDVTSTWFEPHALVDRTAGYSFHACAAFDVDGDGDPDFVTGGSEGRNTASTTVGVPPKVFLNVAGQRFVDGSKPALPMLQDAATALEAGDVDGDGDVDLLIAGWGYYWHQGSPPVFSVWKQDATGAFRDPSALPVPPMGFGYNAMKLADVDGDGDRDLVAIVGRIPAYGGMAGQHRLALNDGAGNFTDVTSTRMPATANTAGASCDVGDVDGDGDVDVVIGSDDYGWSSTGVPLKLLLNNGNGFFTDAVAQMPATPFQGFHVALRDFDADGDLDLVVAAGQIHTTSALYFANDGTGFFTDATASRLPAVVASGLSVLDLDHDGDLDIAQSGFDLRNDGTGHFTASSAPTRMLTVDLDENGVADSIADNPVRVVGGRGLFSSWNIFEFLVLPVDLDADADLDLVVAALPQNGNPDWKSFRIELIYNLRRDLRVVTQPRLGQPYRMQLRATNGTQATVAFVCLATATLSPRLDVPGFGSLLLDPAAVIPYATVVIPDPDTAVEVAVPLPNLLAFQGLPLSCQSLVIPIGDEVHAHLTNGMTHTIER